MSREDNVLAFTALRLPQHIEVLLRAGEYSRASEEVQRALQSASGDERVRLLYELYKLKRIEREYPYTIEEAFSQALGEVPSLTLEEFRGLLGRGCVDHIVYDGRIRVFRRFLPNMFWLCPDLSERRRRKGSEVEEIAREALARRAKRVVEAASREGSEYVLPLRYRVRFTLKVKGRSCADKLRVWVPMPREDELNRDVRLVDSSPKPKVVAPPDHPQRTAYFELGDGEGEVTVVYEYTSYGFHVRLDPREAYVDESGEIYEKYTSEKPPHIVFTDYLVDLTRRVVGDEKNPLLKARRIWDWITSNVRYTYARDYALYDCISEYVARELRGDCGMQALLFITMARIAGIPARWQSGWYMNPVRPGMHDWAQMHVEPYGWLYVDPSFGGRRHGEAWRSDFYFGSTEGYRLAANIDVSTQFHPPKTHFRSDPVDNQQGEVECEDRNLYYDEWESKLEILEVERVE